MPPPPRGYSARDSPAEVLKKAPIQTLKERLTAGDSGRGQTQSVWHNGTAADGNPMFEVLTTVTFAGEGGKTKQILRACVIKSTAQADPYLVGMEQGWTQSLQRLAYVAKHAKE